MYPRYIIGLGRAKELAFTGEPVSAADAYRIGLVNQIFPAEELLDQTANLAATLSRKPRQVLFETRRLSRELIGLDTALAMKLMIYEFRG
jgi:enoyl-CoA hydratase/carnithine racemase